MAEATSKGSPIYKLVILVLIVILFLAIYIPSRTWDLQAQRTSLCRQRMDDIHRASQRFTEVHRYYTPSLDEIVEFMRQDTMVIGPARFERERLNLIPGKADSLLIGFPDSFHVEKVSWESPREDSLVLNLDPYPRYSMMPSSRWAFASDSAIYAFYRDQFEGDNFLIVHTVDSLRLTPLPGDSVRAATREYLLSMPLDSIDMCPAVNRPHELNVNIKITLNGVATTIVHREPPSDTTAADTTLQKLVLNKFRGDAIARAQEVINQDTALTNMKDSLRFAQIKDSLFYDFFEGKIEELRPGDKLRLESDNFVNTSSDSIAAWDDILRIKAKLFSLPPDPLLNKLAQREMVQDVLSRITFEEDYAVTKIDTVGITIKCPIVEEDRSGPRGFINTIFGVMIEDNHGNIKNGDLSWSEKR